MRFLCPLFLLLCLECGKANGFVTIIKVIDFFIQIDKQFLNAIQPQPGLKDFLLASLNSSNPAGSIFSLIVSSTYLGYFILLLIGIAVLCISVVAVVAFCVSRLCLGRCGAYVGPIDDADSQRKRLVYGTLLGIFTTAMLFFFCLSILSNIATHDALFYSTNSSTYLLFNSLNSLQNVVTTMARTYKDKVVSRIVQDASVLIANGSLAASVFATSLESDLNLDGVLSITNGFYNVYKTFMDNLGSFNQTDLQLNLGSLNSTLVSSKTPLIDAIRSECNSTIPACSNAISMLETLSLGFNYSMINASEPSSCLQKINATFNFVAFQRYINQSTNNLKLVGVNESAIFNASLATIVIRLNSTTNLASTYFPQIEPLMYLLAAQIQNTTSLLFNASIPTTNATISQNGIQMLDNYRFYPCLVMSIITGVFIFLFYLGLSFGICGDPTMEDASFCNKGRGSSILVLALFMILSVFWLLLLLEMALFFSGGVVETEACRFFNGNNVSVLNDLVNTAIQLTAKAPNNLTTNILTNLLVTCSFNKSLIVDLGLLSYIPFNDAFIKLLQPQLNSTRDKLYQGNYNIGIENIVASLNNLQTCFPCLSEKTTNELGKDMLSSSEDAIVSNLSSVLNVTQNSPSLVSRIKDFNTTMANMQGIYSQYDSIFGTLKSQQTQLQVSQIPLGILYWSNAMGNVNGNSRSLGISKSMDYLTNFLSEYMRRTITGVLSGNSDCSSVSLGLNQTISTACNNVIAPFNAFAGSMGMLLVLLVPCIHLAGGLSTLYRKSIKCLQDSQKDIIFMPSQLFYPMDSNGKPIGRTFFLNRMEEKNTTSDV